MSSRPLRTKAGIAVIASSTCWTLGRMRCWADPAIIEPTDAVIRVVRACICGSDLWPYNSMAPSETGQSMGHEGIGVVEELGADVRTVKRGDVVVMPFAISDGTCEFCHEGLTTACAHVGFFGNNGMNGRAG
jgi:threonine dehydrogenase-like Zn-dependent dehydrogenase